MAASPAKAYKLNFATLSKARQYEQRPQQKTPQAEFARDVLRGFNVSLAASVSASAKVIGSAVVFFAVRAIRGGADVLGRSVDRVAGREREAGGDGEKGEKLTNHVPSPESYSKRVIAVGVLDGRFNAPAEALVPERSRNGFAGG